MTGPYDERGRGDDDAPAPTDQLAIKLADTPEGTTDLVTVDRAGVVLLEAEVAELYGACDHRPPGERSPGGSDPAATRLASGPACRSASRSAELPRSWESASVPAGQASSVRLAVPSVRPAWTGRWRSPEQAAEELLEAMGPAWCRRLAYELRQVAEAVAR